MANIIKHLKAMFCVHKWVVKYKRDAEGRKYQVIVCDKCGRGN